MPTTKIHCGPNVGPFEGTVQGDAEEAGAGADAKKRAEEKAELAALDNANKAVAALLDKCPGSCPRVANIKGEMPIKPILIPNQTKPTKVKILVPAYVLTINLPSWFGGGPIKIPIPAHIEKVDGWKATATATWRVDSFECIEGA
jgi:hypothetical protein